MLSEYILLRTRYEIKTIETFCSSIIILFDTLFDELLWRNNDYNNSTMSTPMFEYFARGVLDVQNLLLMASPLQKNYDIE